MTEKERALQIADTICKVVPKAVLDAVNGDKLLAALLSAEAYFKMFPTESKDESLRSPDIVDMFLHGSCLKYLYTLTGYGKDAVLSTLWENKIPAVDAGKFYTVNDIDRYRVYNECGTKSWYDEALYSEIIAKVHALHCPSGVLYLGRRSKLVNGERELWESMLKTGYSYPDIASNSGVILTDVLKTLGIENNFDSKTSMMIDLWQRGRAISVIAAITKIHVDVIVNTLKQLGYSFADLRTAQYPELTIRKLGSASWIHVIRDDYNISREEEEVVKIMTNLGFSYEEISDRFSVPLYYLSKLISKYEKK